MENGHLPNFPYRCNRETEPNGGENRMVTKMKIQRRRLLASRVGEAISPSSSPKSESEWESLPNGRDPAAPLFEV